jgi:Ca2+-binding EF-hand superfamily protein
MISGISVADNSCYLQHLQQLQKLQQSQSNIPSAEQVFSKIDTNGDGSISKDEFTTFQSSVAKQSESSIMGSQSDSTSAFLALLQSAGLAAAESSTSTTAASKSTTSQKSSTTADQLFSKIDTNGDGSISKDEFAKVGASIHRDRHRAAHKAGPKSGSTSPVNKLFSNIDTSGDRYISKDEMITFFTNLGSTTNSGTAVGNKLTTTV